MDSTSVYTVLITAITILGSEGAWKYYQKNALRKFKSEDYMKDECRERIVKLEVLLEKSSKEKDDFRNKILELTREVAALRVKVEFLEENNDELKGKKPLPKKRVPKKTVVKKPILKKKVTPIRKTSK